MDIQDRIEELKRLEGTDIMNAMVVNVLMNNYTLENVAFGKLKPNDKLPFDKYVEDLTLQQYKPYLFRDCIEGSFITGDGRIADKAEDDFIKECFLFHINFVFMTAPKRSGDFDEDGLFLFKRGFGKFIMSLYPLFKQIIKTDVEVDMFDIVPVFNKRHDEAACYERISKFLVAIKAKGLRQGGCVDRYVKDLPYIPYFVQRLLNKNKNRYLLSNSDTESLDYKLAVLSAVHFMKWEHTKLFNSKRKNGKV